MPSSCSIFIVVFAFEFQSYKTFNVQIQLWGAFSPLLLLSMLIYDFDLMNGWTVKWVPRVCDVELIIYFSYWFNSVSNRKFLFSNLKSGFPYFIAYLSCFRLVQNCCISMPCLVVHVHWFWHFRFAHFGMNEFNEVLKILFSWFFPFRYWLKGVGHCLVS